MSVITIFQNVYQTGEAVAERVAQTLGYRCVGRNALVESARRYGMNEAKLNEMLEIGPDWWDQWHRSARRYRVALQAGMVDLAQNGNIVYRGHLGHELLPGVLHVVKVLLTAPKKFRVQQIQALRGLDETAAWRATEQMDESHSRRLMAMFQSDWRDPGRYDIVLNMAQMSFEVAAHLIVETVRRGGYRESPASKQVFHDLATAVKVEAALLKDPRFSGLALDVLAERDQVRLSGALPKFAPEQEVVEAAKRVPGVEKVTTAFFDLPESSS